MTKRKKPRKKKIVIRDFDIALDECDMLEGEAVVKEDVKEPAKK